MESVLLITDIHSNSNNTEAAFTTKLARPLNLPGQWRVKIDDISYPHQWTTIHQDMTYAVLFPMINCTPEYDHHSILHEKQPIGLGATKVNTVKPEGLNKIEGDLFEDVKEIKFLDTAALYEVLTDTISEGEHTDPSSIVKQIEGTIETLYRRRFPDAGADECKDIVTFNPITRKVTFKNLVRSRYLIAVPSTASIISMFGHGSRSIKITTSSKREIEVLPVETENSASSILRIRNPLPVVDKVNLRTLDNVFVYSDIVEQSLISESQGNFLGFFPIKSKFGETGYWSFNPPNEYKVMRNFIDTISIKLSRPNGELFPFKNGQIIIRLKFLRIV